VTVNPHARPRLITMENEISQTSFIKILHNYKFHPYHKFFHQNLYGNGFANRINFCNWMRQQLDFHIICCFLMNHCL